MQRLMRVWNVISFTTGDDLLCVTYFVVISAHLTLDAANISPQIKDQ